MQGCLTSPLNGEGSSDGSPKACVQSYPGRVTCPQITWALACGQIYLCSEVSVFLVTYLWSDLPVLRVTATQSYLHSELPVAVTCGQIDLC